MASFLTNEGASRLSKGLAWDGASTIKARLVSSGSTPTKDETVMTGFTAIGTDQTLAQGNRVVTKDVTNDQLKLRYTTTLTWAAVAAGSTVGWIMVYVEDAAADASRVPLAVIDISPDVPTNGGDLTYTPPTVNGDTNVIAYSTQ